MNPRDPWDLWKAERRDAQVPDGFADRVMEAIGPRRPALRADDTAPARRSISRVSAVLALAAGVCVVVAWHAALLGAVLWALPGTAR
jgi:hypothetical protein